jgi:hypothetical protein
MTESEETLSWEGYTAHDTSSQVVIERTDDQAQIVLPEHWFAGRRHFSLLSALGEQPLLQEPLTGVGGASRPYRRWHCWPGPRGANSRRAGRADGGR